MQEVLGVGEVVARVDEGLADGLTPDSLLDRFLANPAYLGRVAQRITTFSLEFATATQPSLTLPAPPKKKRLAEAVANAREIFRELPQQVPSPSSTATASILRKPRKRSKIRIFISPMAR